MNVVSYLDSNEKYPFPSEVKNQLASRIVRFCRLTYMRQRFRKPERPSSGWRPVCRSEADHLILCSLYVLEEEHWA